MWKKLNNIVVKVGTECVVARDGFYQSELIGNLAEQIDDLLLRGVKVTLVASGSVELGRQFLKHCGKNGEPFSKHTDNLFSKGAMAGISNATFGFSNLFANWSYAFHFLGKKRKNRITAQMLLTHANLQNQSESAIIKRNLLSYLRNGVVPIINENDVVAEDEIIFWEKKIGENDKLARLIAEMIGADGVLFITKIGGVYDRDPAKKGAKRLAIIGTDFESKIGVMKGKSQNGSGGMGKKLQSAFECHTLGMRIAIAGPEQDVMRRFVIGGRVGTMVNKTTTW